MKIIKVKRLIYIFFFLYYLIFHIKPTESNKGQNINDDKHSRKNYMIIILNQNEPQHIKKAQILQKELTHTAELLNISITSKIATEEINYVASWTYLPLAKILLSDPQQALWYIFLEEHCKVDLEKLHHLIPLEGSHEDYFFARGLKDESATITHHFDGINSDDPFLYPDSRTGIIISRSLMRRLALEWNPLQSKIDFSIDASYELSKEICNLEVRMENQDFICLQKDDKCAIWVDEDQFFNDKKERTPVPLDRIHFAVKTCKKYFLERIPVLNDTWFPRISNYKLYSTDVEDKHLPFVVLDVPNVSLGHCEKTLSLIRHVAEHEDMDWLVVADDDTLLSPERLSSFLSSYDSSSKIALGERYGYMLANLPGFNYLTGGAGMVFSKETVTLLSKRSICDCPSDDTPDDMFIGSCLQRHQIPMVHSRRFHQARPDDYPTTLLKDSKPISFHKFWMINPRETYKNWLEESPVPVSDNTKHKPFSEHTEF